MSVNTPVTPVNIPQTIDLSKVKEVQRFLGATNTSSMDVASVRNRMRGIVVMRTTE